MTTGEKPQRLPFVGTKGKAVHVAWSVGMEGGSFKVTQDERRVRVMAVAEGYAMVRRTGCAPYVAALQDLFIP